MTIINRETLKKLAEVCDAPAVSIFVSRPNPPVTAIQNQKQIKNIFIEAESRMSATGFSQATVKTLFAPAEQIVANRFRWDYGAKTLVIFISPSMMVVDQVAVEIPRAVYVSDRFYIKPLLGLLLENRTTYVLALSRSRIRLIKGGTNGGAVILEQHFKNADNTGEQSQEKPTAADSPAPSAFNQKVPAPKETRAVDGGFIRDRYYLRRADEMVNGRIADRSAPLVLAATPRLSALYRQVSRYPTLLQTPIDGNPDNLSANQLLAGAKPIVHSFFQSRQLQEVSQFQDLKQTEMSSDDIRTVVSAACNARVDKLFMRRGKQIWGRYNGSNEQVFWADPTAKGARDLLNFAAINSLRQGADVFLLPPEAMPTDKPVAALFRYPRRMHAPL